MLALWEVWLAMNNFLFLPSEQNPCKTKAQTKVSNKLASERLQLPDVLEALRDHSELWPKRDTWKHNVGFPPGLPDSWGPALPSLSSVSRNTEARVPVTICSSKDGRMLQLSFSEQQIRSSLVPEGFPGYQPCAAIFKLLGESTNF